MEKTEKSDTLYDVMYRNKLIRDKKSNRDMFKKLFGLNLFDYYDLITGFDLIRLDKVLFSKRKDYAKKAMCNMLRQKYGEESVEFVRSLYMGSVELKKPSPPETNQTETLLLN